MSFKDLDEIEKELKKIQNEKRFRHTTGVEYTSACLAMRWGADLHKALLAGLLHDCAKHMKPQDLLKECIEKKIPYTKAQERSPFLLHGPVGAYFARNKYGVKDQEVLGAITWHTTGRPGMTLLEKIVFTADYIEPGRDQAPDLERLRQMAFTDLDGAVVLILRQTLDYLEESGAPIDPMTRDTYEYYRKMKREV